MCRDKPICLKEVLHFIQKPVRMVLYEALEVVNVEKWLRRGQPLMPFFGCTTLPVSIQRAQTQKKVHWEKFRKSRIVSKGSRSASYICIAAIFMSLDIFLNGIVSRGVGLLRLYTGLQFRANPNLGVTFVTHVFISGSANLYDNSCNWTHCFIPHVLQH